MHVNLQQLSKTWNTVVLFFTWTHVVFLRLFNSLNTYVHITAAVSPAMIFHCILNTTGINCYK